MGCERYKDWLTDAALGALPRGRQEELRAHLRACPACHAEMQKRERLSAAIERGLAACVAALPSPDFAAAVRRRIAVEAERRDWWLAGWFPAAAGALSVVVLLALWFLPRGRGPERAAERVAVPTSSLRLDSARATTPVRVPPPRVPAPRAPASLAVPEVLVPLEEREGFRRLAEAIERRRLDLAAVLAPAARSPATVEPLEVAELKIPPLEIAPLDAGPAPAVPAGKP